MKYIDKAAVVAEIEKRKRKNVLTNEGAFEEDIDILSFLNTIEVKEADLDKELESFIEHRKAWVKDNWEVEYNNGDSFNHIYDLKDVAKHFFELGLSVSNKAQKGERV